MFGSNSTCTCATTRLLELRMYGVCQYIVTERLEMLAAAGGTAWKLHASAAKQVLEASDKEDDEDLEEYKYWEPVLYLWQVAAGDLDEDEEPGQLVFTDFTTTRFLVVNVNASDCADVKTKAASQANSFFNLAHYIGYKPEFVLFASLTPAKAEIPEDLRNFIKAVSSLSNLPCPSPAGDGWGVITSSTFSPCLSETQLQRIDEVCKGALSGHMGGGVMASFMGALSPSSMVPRIVRDCRAEAGLTAEQAYAQVLNQATPLALHAPVFLNRTRSFD
jgi:hypothetical protein